jgi:hypothetical protein
MASLNCSFGTAEFFQSLATTVTGFPLGIVPKMQTDKGPRSGQAKALRNRLLWASAQQGAVPSKMAIARNVKYLMIIKTHA